MDPLLYEPTALTHQQRRDLGVVTEMPGFAVIKLLFDDACDQSMKAVIKINPETEGADQKIKVRQMISRLTNDICATLLKSIVMHTQIAIMTETKEQERKALEVGETPEGDEAPKPLGEKFGSFVIKPRRKADQS